MTKADLLDRISRSRNLPPDVRKKAVSIVVDAVFDEITRALRRDGKFAYPHFGTFERKRRAARKGLNPQTGKVIKIPARNTVVFRPTRSLKSAVQHGR